jgi:uncharacterized membrane protein YbhN (UPF0104 family)
MRVLVAGLIALAAWLLWDLLRDVDWRQVGATLAAYPAGTLAVAAAFVAASYALYAGYDLLGRRYTHHALRVPTVAAIACVVYASNLSLGPIVGSVGLRLRLYTRYGLRAAQVARIVGLGLVTNWSGYLLLAGSVLALRQVELPAALSMGAGALQALGALMIALPVAYVAACAFARRREWHFRGHHFRLPHGRMAALQLLLSCANWAAIAGVIWVLLPAGLPYGVVLATFLTASVVALATHIPGGLGVLEGVFLYALASPQAPSHALLAGLLAFRALYYLLPLALAGAAFVMLEAGAPRRG